MDVNREPLTFCMRRYICKKHKIDVMGRQSEAPCFLYALISWSCVQLKVSILHHSGTLIASWVQLADRHNA
jgi:hypothetical protein